MMLPISYVHLQSKKSLKVDILLVREGEARKLLGIQLRPNEIQMYLFVKGPLTKDYHVSRHQSGQQPETLEGFGDYYPIRHGKLGAPQPFPFRLRLSKPQKPRIDEIRGVETLDLSQAPWLQETFVKPVDLFASGKASKSKADHQFQVSLSLLTDKLVRFGIFLVEPNNRAAIETHLEHLQRHPRGYKVGSPFAQPVTKVAVHQVEVYPSFKPWLAIALLTGG